MDMLCVNVLMIGIVSRDVWSGNFSSESCSNVRNAIKHVTT